MHEMILVVLVTSVTVFINIHSVNLLLESKPEIRTVKNPMVLFLCKFVGIRWVSFLMKLDNIKLWYESFEYGCNLKLRYEKPRCNYGYFPIWITYRIARVWLRFMLPTWCHNQADYSFIWMKFTGFWRKIPIMVRCLIVCFLYGL